MPQADKPILAVFGATGHQGGAIISHFLSLPSSTNPYTLRALTRNPSSPKAQNLAEAGVSVIHADLDSPASLKSALEGVSAVFLVTDFWSAPDAHASNETRQAKTVLDILAASSTLRHLVFSSLPSVREVSRGKYTSVVHFDGKADVVAWLQQTHKALWEKTTVAWMGTYMQLWLQFEVFAPRRVVEQGQGQGEGKGNEVWELATIFHPHTRLPLVDVADAGVAVKTILDKREGCMGQTVSLVAPGPVTLEEQLRTWGRAVGKEVSFREVSEEESWVGIEGMGLEAYLAKDMWETGMAFRECEGRLLHQEGVVQVSQILPPGVKLTTWSEYVEKEDWSKFLKG